MRYTLGKSKVIINQFGKNKLRNNVIVSLIPRFLLGALTVRKVESDMLHKTSQYVFMHPEKHY